MFLVLDKFVERDPMKTCTPYVIFVGRNLRAKFTIILISDNKEFGRKAFMKFQPPYELLIQKLETVRKQKQRGNRNRKIENRKRKATKR